MSATRTGLHSVARSQYASITTNRHNVWRRESYNSNSWYRFQHHGIKHIGASNIGHFPPDSRTYNVWYTTSSASLAAQRFSLGSRNHVPRPKRSTASVVHLVIVSPHVIVINSYVVYNALRSVATVYRLFGVCTNWSEEQHIFRTVSGSRQVLSISMP